MVASTEWPFKLSDAGPDVFDLYDQGERERHADLHPVRYPRHSRITSGMTPTPPGNAWCAAACCPDRDARTAG